MSNINEMIVSDYHDKGVDFSASDFTVPNYMLWVKKNLPKNEDVEQGLQPWVGQLIHDASYNHKEINVIKEFSGVRVFYGKTIGGSIDRVEYYADQTWQIADIKSQGMFPAKSAFKKPKEEWIKQLSVYRWILADYGFDVDTTGIIHQYVLGFQKNKDGMEMYNRLEIPLMSLEDTQEMIANKIDIAIGDEPVSCDCPSWMCESYCDYTNSCTKYKGE